MDTKKQEFIDEAYRLITEFFHMICNNEGDHPEFDEVCRWLDKYEQLQTERKKVIDHAS